MKQLFTVTWPAWVKKFIAESDKKPEPLGPLPFGYDLNYYINLLTLAFFTMLFSAVLGLGAAWLLSFPGGVAGFIASMAVASGMALPEFIPAFAFALIVLTSFAFYFIDTVSFKQDAEMEDMYAIDDVMAELLNLREQVDELKRKVESQI